MNIFDRLCAGWKAWLILFAITFAAGAPGVFFLPALDRDESRFAQSSKQYLETGDYIVLRYQDEYRNKKPAGIHWLQAGATALFGDGDRLQIWTYRIPSWIGAALSTIALFWAGIVLVGRQAAFLGAALYGSTLLLTSEAHIAKTDGVLVFLTALGLGALARLYMRDDRSRKMALLFWLIMGLSFLIKGPVTMIVAAYAGLGAWVWSKTVTGKGGAWWRPLIWWPGPVLCIAIILPWFIWIQLATGGEYIKGAVGKDLKDKFVGASEGHGGWLFYHLTHVPVWFFPAVILLIPGVSAACKHLYQHDHTATALKHGAMICVILGVLTALAAWLLPDGIGAGIPAIYPALLLLAFGWLAIGRRSVQPEDRLPAHAQHVRNMADISGGTANLDQARALRFVLAWAVLTTLFFELMPTRLSHYILPAYPAYALLCGWVGGRLMDGMRLPVSRLLSFVLYVMGGGFLLIIGTPFAFNLFRQEAAADFTTVDTATVLQQWAPYAAFPLWFWIAGGCAFIGSAGAFLLGRLNTAFIAAIVTGLFFGWHIRTHVLPSQAWLHPTESARLALGRVCGIPGGAVCADGYEPPGRVLALGYAEPSYVMTMGTQNLHPPETPLDLPRQDGLYPVVYLVNMEDGNSRRAIEAITRQARTQGRCITTSDPVYALNYSNGDPVSFRAWRFEAAACPGRAHD